MPADEVVEQLARLIHDDYLAHLEVHDPGVPTHRPWSELADSDRELNRAQARDNVVKLYVRGLLVVAAGASDELVEIPEQILEEMAIEEHRSWVARRESQGYRYGPVRSDDPDDLRHPDMVAWADLGEDVREKDRRPIRNIPLHLRAVGLTLVRA